MNFSTLVILVVAAVCIDSTFAQVKFRSCGSAAVKKIQIDGSDNKATPTLMRGKQYTIRADYTAGQDSSNLKTQFFAILGGNTVKWEGISLKEGCESVQPGCPIVKGRAYTYIEEIMVPRDAPAMRTVVKVKQDNEKNSEVLCFIFSLLIK